MLIEGALIALAGVLVGRFLPSRRRGPKPPKPVQPICGCGHHRSYHPDGSKCTFDVERWSTARGMYRDSCPCGQYVGPEPLPEFFAQEIGSGS